MSLYAYYLECYNKGQISADEMFAVSERARAMICTHGLMDY